MHSFITSRNAGHLGLRGTKVALDMSTLHATNEMRYTKVHSLKLKGDNGSVLSVPRVYETPDIPMPNITFCHSLRHLEGLSFIRNYDRVDLLLGQDCFQALVPLEVRTGEKNEPFAVRSLLGWYVCGPSHAEFQHPTRVESVLMYGATACTVTKTLESKLDGTYTRMLRAILNISWRTHPPKQQLYGKSPPISDILQQRPMRFAGHCWRAKQELASNLLLWTPSHGRTRVGRPATTYVDQLCEDVECLPNDLPNMMLDNKGWRARVKNVRASST
ncbi:Uncharacterised protein r2_g2127 [Pycnogonum litorale]